VLISLPDLVTLFLLETSDLLDELGGFAIVTAFNFNLFYQRGKYAIEMDKNYDVYRVDDCVYQPSGR
jgi:hypothetical protein